MQSLYHGMSEALIITDKSGLIESVNRRAEELLGMTQKELLKRHIHALLTPRQREIRSEEISKDKTTGLIMWLLNPAESLQGDSVNEGGASTFLAAMTHEIRTPKNGIIGMTDLAIEEELSPTLKEYLSIIKLSANSLMRVINDILDYSKIESGSLNMENIPIPFPVFLDSIVKLFTPQAESKGLEFRYHPEDDIPEIIMGDPVRIRQIIQNLLNNALKFTPEGYIEFSSYVDTDKSRIYFSISDSGIGIPEEKQHLLFKSFTQIDASTTRKYGGTGLGLAICAYLTSCMGGQIDVNSRASRGSTFRFFLPLILPEQEKDETGTVEEKKQDFHLSSEGPLILLLEDNRVNQLLAVKTMEKAGYRVVTAEDGFQGIKRYREHKPDLILMDIQMPGKDGYETAAEIREMEEGQDEQTPIIALTALALDADKKKIKKAGMNDFLGKPVSPIDLKEMLLKYCREK
ncbi:MAG: ATP-binding protein [Spirochaetales bacterium]|nr:ATP-binding protein [Spirochaetales bacterium]